MVNYNKIDATVSIDYIIPRGIKFGFLFFGFLNLKPIEKNA